MILSWSSWFKKDKEHSPILNVPTTPTDIIPFPKQPEPEPGRDECHYTVGTTDTGKTVLRVGAQYNTQITLTMNQSATRHLIKMLEATITDYDEDEE